MSEPIKVGDLVIVIKPAECCGHPSALGEIMRVVSIKGGPVTCSHCHSVRSQMDCGLDDGFYYSPSRLKRIPPPSELNIVEERERIEA